MAMGRKQFEMIAKAVKGQVALAEEASQDTGAFYLRNLADDLADGFRAENPRFDRDRFLRACGF